MLVQRKDYEGNLHTVGTHSDEYYKGKRIYSDILLDTRRLDKIEDVLQFAFMDNPKTLIVTFELILPESAIELRNQTLEDNSLYRRFIQYLAAEIEIEVDIHEEGKYIPNKLRYLLRKRIYRHITEIGTYYAYKVAVVVNHDLYEDIHIVSVFNEGLMHKVATAWAKATKLSYAVTSGDLNKQSVDIYVINNYDDCRMKSLHDAYFKLSNFAYVNVDLGLCEKDAFDFRAD
jgi:hypothetical protein